MLAAVKFGLRHQLLLQTETRLGLAHKTPIPNHDLFLETFVSEMMAADRSRCPIQWLAKTDGSRALSGFPQREAPRPTER